MGLTTDRNDPGLNRNQDGKGQNEKYLILSEEERAKGFVRPVRRSYQHVGPEAPRFELRDLTEDQAARTEGCNYVKYEVYPESEAPVTGKFWTQEQLDSIGKGCRTVTTMAQAIAETYARDPSFYGATFCGLCNKHLPVGEFIWEGTRERVGS